MDAQLQQEITKRKTPITPEEIDQAETVIDDYMPYRNEPYKTAFPILSCFYKKQEPQVDDENLESPLLEGEGEAGAKPNKGGKSKSDPYLYFGYGMVSYFNLLTYLMAFFLLGTLLNVPAYVFYSSENPDGPLNGNWLTQFTLANLGYSQSKCFSVLSAASALSMKCPSGRMTKLVSYGVIPNAS